ncbi:MAG TPA: hypothetical protein VEF04_21985 [Blastocatellia bacterium]|nr:hypothetical protein [Blastocatellia bacterium]
MNTVLPGKTLYWLGGVVLLVIVVFASAIAMAPNPEDTAVQSSTAAASNESTETDSAKVGEEAVLRFGTSDVVFLATDEASFQILSKSIASGDTYGMIELAANGKGFGVGQDTKVLIIDSGVGKRKVRILSSSRKIDQDKIGLSGWTFAEAVVRN